MMDRNRQTPLKIAWSGRVVSVQPRIRLTRSFDERSHSYLGYCLTIDGIIGDETRVFSIGVGQEAHRKFQFEVGAEVSGESVSVPDKRLEPVEYYKTSKLEILSGPSAGLEAPPPWHGVPPDLPTYRARGHRRLSSATYDKRCKTCIWGCRMPVTIIVDHWKPDIMRYRFETFCYGPKSCSFYKPGPVRQVPGRRGMVWEEQDWVDEGATAHREWDE